MEPHESVYRLRMQQSRKAVKGKTGSYTSVTRRVLPLAGQQYRLDVQQGLRSAEKLPIECSHAMLQELKAVGVKLHNDSLNIVAGDRKMVLTGGGARSRGGGRPGDANPVARHAAVYGVSSRQRDVERRSSALLVHDHGCEATLAEHLEHLLAAHRLAELTESFLPDPSALPQLHIPQGSLADYDQLLDHPEQLGASQAGAA